MSYEREHSVRGMTTADAILWLLDKNRGVVEMRVLRAHLKSRRDFSSALYKLIEERKMSAWFARIEGLRGNPRILLVRPTKVIPTDQGYSVSEATIDKIRERRDRLGRGGRESARRKIRGVVSAATAGQVRSKNAAAGRD